jgi:hypothetical protein
LFREVGVRREVQPINSNNQDFASIHQYQSYNMLSTTIFSTIIALTGLVVPSVAHPTDKHKLASEKHHANHTDSLMPFNATIPPIVQIHPANRTDLVSPRSATMNLR